MSRRMIAPGVWVDEEPREAHLRRHPHDARPASIVGDMTPVLVGSVLSMTRQQAAVGDDAHAKADRYLRTAWSIRPENRKPRCGRVMKSGDPCGQIADHKDSCRSAKAMAGRTWSKRRAA